MYKILDWAKFAYRFSGSLQAAFETMAYHMFCREFDITKGLPAVYNQKFIETEPYVGTDGTIAGFQAKYYETTSITAGQKDDLIKAVRGAAATYEGINTLYFYVSKEFAGSSSAGVSKSRAQAEIEEAASELGIRIEWVLPSQMEIILNRPDHADILEYFFGDETDDKLLKEIAAVRKMREILLQQRNDHPSFRLLANGLQSPYTSAAKNLFPKGIKPAERFMVYKDEEDRESMPVQVADLIAASWTNGRGGSSQSQGARGAGKIGCNRHLQIQGVGGIGKTVLLLSLTTEPGYLPHDVPSVYIPMYELNDYDGENVIMQYLENLFDRDTVNVIDALSKKPWDDGPSLLLLLDGFNELALRQKQALIWRDISRWAARRGVQIITTSRAYSGSTMNRFMPVTLQELDEDTIIRYLSDYNREHHTSVAVPAKGDRLLRLLTIPLMLTLYIQVEEIRASESEYPYLAFRSSFNAGTLISNYIQKEIYNYASYISDSAKTIEISGFVFIMTAIVPYLMYEMERDSLFAVDEMYLRQKIDEALQYFGNKPYCIPSQVYSAANYEQEDFDWLGSDEIFEQLTRKSGVLVRTAGPDGTSKYRPMHQDFRDGLAALFLCSIGQGHISNKTELPPEYRISLGSFVVRFMGEVLQPDEVQKLWEMNRSYEPTNANSTRLLMDLIGQQRGRDYTDVDFSGMDLSEISLYPYLSGWASGGRLLCSGRKAFAGARISEATFLPQGHSRSIKTIVISPDGRWMASGAYEEDIRVWDLENGTFQRALKGHNSWINALAVSLDGRFLVSGSEDHTGRIWDMRRGESGACSSILHGHTGSIKSLAISPDVRLVASGSSDGTIRIWDIEDGRLLHILQGHNDQVNAVAFSHDGHLIVSGSEDRTVRVWDVGDNSGTSRGKCLHTLQGHEGGVNSLVVSPVGNLVVSGSSDNKIMIWNIKDGTCMRTLEGHTNWINVLAMSADGKRLVSGSSDSEIRIWNMESGAYLHILKGHKSWVNTLVLSADGRRLVSGSDDMTVRIWDAETGKCLHVLEEHDGWINVLALSTDGRRVVSGSSDRTMNVWDVESGTRLYTIEGHTGGVRSMAMFGNQYLVSGSSDNTLRIWDMNNLKCTRVLKGHDGWINAIAINHDGSRLASGSTDGTIRIWDPANGKLIHILEGHEGWVNVVAMSRDGFLLASGSSDGTIRIWDAITGRLLRVLSGHTGRVNVIALSANGKRLVSGADDATIRIWNVNRGVCQYTMKGHTGMIRAIALGRSNQLLASGAADKIARIWDVSRRSCLKELRWHNSWVNSVAFSSDGKLLATGSSDKMVRIWDVASGRCLHVMEGHKNRVRTVFMSSDDRFLVSGSNDKTVRIWNVSNGKCLQELEGHTDRIRALILSSDDRLIISGSYDGTVRVWEAESGKCLDVLSPFPSCDLTGVDLSSAIFDNEKTRLRCSQNGAIV